MTAEPPPDGPVEYRSIAAGTGMGPVRLAVTDRTRALAFYRDVLGLTVLDDNDPLRLGTGDRELVVLDPGSQDDVAPGTTGLYHLAILVPDLGEFARMVRRFTDIGFPHSPTDHTMTKSDYLWDPDGNGIEIYAESPEDGTWFMSDDTFGAIDSKGRPRSGRDPIPLGDLFARLEPDDDPFAPLAQTSKMGHVHLHVRNVEEAIGFYRDLIGFDVMGTSVRFGVAFVSAGGYHHHLGLNTWAGKGAPPPPAGRAGLREFTIEVPDATELQAVSERLEIAGVALSPSPDAGVSFFDPSLNPVRVTVAPAPGPADPG